MGKRENSGEVINAMLNRMSGDIEWKFHTAHNSVTSPLLVMTRGKFHVAKKLKYVHITYSPVEM